MKSVPSESTHARRFDCTDSKQMSTTSFFGPCTSCRVDVWWLITRIWSLLSSFAESTSCLLWWNGCDVPKRPLWIEIGSTLIDSKNLIMCKNLSHTDIIVGIWWGGEGKLFATRWFYLPNPKESSQMPRETSQQTLLWSQTSHRPIKELTSLQYVSDEVDITRHQVSMVKLLFPCIFWYLAHTNLWREKMKWNEMKILHYFYLCCCCADMNVGLSGGIHLPQLLVLTSKKILEFKCHSDLQKSGLKLPRPPTVWSWSYPMLPLRNLRKGGMGICNHTQHPY